MTWYRRNPPGARVAITFDRSATEVEAAMNGGGPVTTFPDPPSETRSQLGRGPGKPRTVIEWCDLFRTVTVPGAKENLGYREWGKRTVTTRPGASGPDADTGSPSPP